MLKNNHLRRENICPQLQKGEDELHLQSFLKQSESSIAFPSQILPPYFGAGLLHFLVLCITPVLQVVEHWDQELHEFQLPSTVIGRDENIDH